MTAQERDGRPTPAEVKRLSVSDGNLDTLIVEPHDDFRPRSRRCRHAIWAQAAILTGLIQECRRAAEGRLAREVAA